MELRHGKCWPTSTRSSFEVNTDIAVQYREVQQNSVPL